MFATGMRENDPSFSEIKIFSLSEMGRNVIIAISLKFKIQLFKLNNKFAQLKNKLYVWVV